MIDLDLGRKQLVNCYLRTCVRTATIKRILAKFKPQPVSHPGVAGRCYAKLFCFLIGFLVSFLVLLLPPLGFFSGFKTLLKFTGQFDNYFVWRTIFVHQGINDSSQLIQAYMYGRVRETAITLIVRIVGIFGARRDIASQHFLIVW